MNDGASDGAPIPKNVPADRAGRHHRHQPRSSWCAPSRAPGSPTSSPTTWRSSSSTTRTSPGGTRRRRPPSRPPDAVAHAAGARRGRVRDQQVAVQAVAVCAHQGGERQGLLSTGRRIVGLGARADPRGGRRQRDRAGCGGPRRQAARLARQRRVAADLGPAARIGDRLYALSSFPRSTSAARPASDSLSTTMPTRVRSWPGRAARRNFRSTSIGISAPVRPATSKIWSSA